MIGTLESLSELWLDGNLLNTLPDVRQSCIIASDEENEEWGRGGKRQCDGWKEGGEGRERWKEGGEGCDRWKEGGEGCDRWKEGGEGRGSVTDGRREGRDVTDGRREGREEGV